MLSLWNNSVEGGLVMRPLKDLVSEVSSPVTCIHSLGQRFLRSLWECFSVMCF